MATLLSLRDPTISAIVLAISSFTSFVVQCITHLSSLLLHLATSDDHGTAPHVLGLILPLLQAARPPASSAISKSVHRNLGIVTGLVPPPPLSALCSLPVHWVPFLRAILAKVGHNGHNAADTSPFRLCGGNEDRSPEAQKVAAEPSLVPGLVWRSKHV